MSRRVHNTITLRFSIRKRIYFNRSNDICCRHCNRSLLFKYIYSNTYRRNCERKYCLRCAFLLSFVDEEIREPDLPEAKPKSKRSQNLGFSFNIFSQCKLCNVIFIENTRGRKQDYCKACKKIRNNQRVKEWLKRKKKTV